MVRESEQLRFLRDLLFKILAGIVSTSGGAPSAALIDSRYEAHSRVAPRMELAAWM